MTSPTAGTAPSSATGDAVRLEGVAFGYGRAPVLSDVSLALPRRGFLTLLGPSGCGKTTLLQLVGGYLTPRAGKVWLNGKDATRLPPEARNAGMVFQNYALFPHLTAAENVGFGLRVRGVPKPERARRVAAMLERVGLSAAEGLRKPEALSGGQQQRVALARALAFGPDVLLLDEPLANLDRNLRDRLRGELRRLHDATGVATLLVTHDREEALALSDTVAVMDRGAILQVGPPRQVYDRPRTPFVAAFLGEANLLAGPRVGRAEGDMVLIRPERVRLAAARLTTRWQWPGRVSATSFQGADTLLEVACKGFVLKVRGRADEGRPERIFVGFDDADAWTIPDRDPVTPPEA